jgi:hypothetical protein
VPLRLKPVARSLSVRAEFLGLELEDWGFVIAWAIILRLLGDHIHRVLMGRAFLYASGQTYKTRFPLMPEPKNRFPLEAAA